MRIAKEVTSIDYNETKQFFKNRAQKFKEDNPYSVTMYQDNNADLVKERNQKEVDKILPMLELNKQSRVLDIACGVGRWADALSVDIEEYCGVDFSGELIKIANERNTKEKFFYLEGAAYEIETVLQKNGRGKYNTILMIGILMYLNDNDIILSLEQIAKACEEHAIYRTREELLSIFQKSFLGYGFSIKSEGFLFDDDELNNRKETSQYYYIFER